METVLFLSDEWVAAVDQCLRTIDTDDAPTEAAGNTDDEAADIGAALVTVRYAIEGGPAGTGGYDLVVGSESGRARRPQGRAEVTLTMGWDLAVAINRGEENAQRAVLDGRIMISGDPQVLLSHQEDLARGNEQVAALRPSTAYTTR